MVYLFLFTLHSATSELIRKFTLIGEFTQAREISDLPVSPHYESGKLISIAFTSFTNGDNLAICSLLRDINYFSDEKLITSRRR
jgi:hypothetical protein